MARTSKRPQRAAQAARLRAAGLTSEDIAEFMSISQSTVRDLLYDPTGEKARARKDRFRRSCVYCGAPTNPGGYRNGAPARCSACAHQSVWTPEAITSALHLFHAEYGRGPTAGEMGCGAQRHQRVEWLPYRDALVKHFGSVAAAFAAAGVPRNAAGRHVSRQPSGAPQKAS